MAALPATIPKKKKAVLVMGGSMNPPTIMHLRCFGKKIKHFNILLLCLIRLNALGYLVRGSLQPLHKIHEEKFGSDA